MAHEPQSFKYDPDKDILSARHSKIAELNLAQKLKDFSERQLKILFEALNSNQSVKTLDLSFNRLNETPLAFTLVLELIRQNHFITKIDFTRNYLTDDQLEELSLTVLGNTTLEEVVFARDEHKLANALEIIRLQTLINRNNHLLGITNGIKENKTQSSNLSSTRESTLFKQTYGLTLNTAAPLKPAPTLTDERRLELIEENHRANETLSSHLAQLKNQAGIDHVMRTRSSSQ